MKHFFDLPLTNNIMKKAIIVSCFLIFSACNSTKKPFNVVEENKQSLAGDGEFVGTLKDGRKLTRYEIINHPYRINSHWIYVIDGSISVNYNIHHAKNITRNETVVILD